MTLTPYPEYQDSGVDWLGDIPSHWEAHKLKYVSQKIIGGSTPPKDSVYWDGNIIWVTPEDISRNDRIRKSRRTITQAGLLACSSVLVPAGSIILTSRAPVGNVALAEAELCTNQGCKTIVVDPSTFDSLYGFFLISSLKNELQSLSKGTTFYEISTSVLANVFIPL
ncbi:MAG: restriction endonuclease subunit S, partial [Anaerolineaceae bacterium]